MLTMYLIALSANYFGLIFIDKCVELSYISCKNWFAEKTINCMVWLIHDYDIDFIIWFQEPSDYFSSAQKRI